MKIQNVLCPVDFSELTERETQVAIEICRTFGARLILEHNLRMVPAMMAKGWEWEGNHSVEKGLEPVAQKKMRELLARMPDDLDVHGTLSHGPMVPTLVHLVREEKVDLVVLGTHGHSTEDHSSLCDNLIDCCPCPVLSIHEELTESPSSQPFRLAADGGSLVDVLVPTDFSKTADEAVSYAFELAHMLPLRLHLFHVVEAPFAFFATPVDHHQTRAPDPQVAIDAARERLVALVPDDLKDRVKILIDRGDVSERLNTMTDRVRPRFLVMGRHARGLIKRYFTHDHSKDMLHEAHCPVWLAGAA